jgi:phosphomethylpyrimidine synthase
VLARWMVHDGAENPRYERFDDVRAIGREHDVTISLGDACVPGRSPTRPMSAKFAELDMLGALTDRAWEQDVQVMVEGPGHVPLDQLEENVRRQQDV